MMSSTAATHRRCEGLAGLAPGGEVPRGVLVAEQLDRLGVLAEDLLEVLLLPIAAEPLAQILALDHLDADALGVHLRRLARPRQGGGVEGGRRGQQRQAVGQQARLLETDLAQRGIVLIPSRGREPRGGVVVRTAMPDQVQTAFDHGAGSSCGRRVGALERCAWRARHASA